MSFSDFLKTHLSNQEKSKMQRAIVEYLSPAEVEQHLVTFEDGKVLQDGKIMKNDLFVFVLNAEGTKLFAGSKIAERFHHSSFVKGEPVQCAGKFYVENGEITLVRLKSGHYKPNKEDGEKLRRYLSSLSRLGSKASSLIIRTKTNPQPVHKIRYQVKTKNMNHENF